MSEEDASSLKIEESRFTGDGSELALLQFLRKAEQVIEILPPDTLLAELQSLHTFFLKLVVPSPNPSLPKPGRPIRHLITRCVIGLHKRVESRSLFDFVAALVKGVSDGGNKNMSAAENVMRVASWYIIGEVMKEMGTNMMSFMAEICTSSVKVLRNSNLSVILRSHAVYSFSRCLIGAGRALPDALVKDLLKALRNGLQDKALPIIRACAEAFINLQMYTSACPLAPTIDSLSPIVWKSFENADYLTRRSLSRLMAHYLCATQTPGSGVVIEPPKKSKKGGEGDVDPNEPTVITSAAEDRTGKTLYTAGEMLKALSIAYNRNTTPRKVRNSIIDIYATLFTLLGSNYVENHYSEIVRHITEDLVSFQKQSTRYEVLATREVAGILLRDLIGVRLLSEAGQVMAIREWTNNYIKKWTPNPLPNQVRPNQNVLIVGLREIAGLLEQLGNASASIIEMLAEPLVRLLSHESYSVRLAASYTLRQFCTINPHQLPRMLNILLADVTKDLSILGTPTSSKEVPIRIVGKTFALSALMAVSPARPLYVSQEISTKAFDLAVSLLKRSGDSDIPSANIQVQVAWYLIASLMSLGSGFVKLHLPQLLVLWRNALPKPTSKDSSVGERGEAEWSFLLLVRECALAAVLNFLRHNSELVNIDVARRLSTLFTNTLNFVNGFATAYAEALREQASNTDGKSAAPASTIFTMRPSLVEREANLRRRVLQCFAALGPSSATESMQSALLQAAITVFADPENYSGSAAQAAIAAQAGQFTGIWQSTDGYAYGVTSLLGVKDGEGTRDAEEPYLNRDKIEMAIEYQLSHPILGSLEHDFLELFPSKSLLASPNPVPSQTGVIDAGVDLFAILLPYQNSEGLLQSLATLSSHMRSSKLEKNPGRRQAVFANTIAALRRSLVNAETGSGKGKKVIASPQVTDLIKGLLQDALFESSPSIRSAAAESMGLLSSIAGSSYLSSQIQWLVDQVVNNRVPDSRAGCALAFGAIYSSVGGLAGGPILKTIVNILMSLSTDPHPIVHFWAMSALTQVVNAANLSYSPYVTNTLGMIANIYLLESHEPDGGSMGYVNLRGDLPAYQIICKLLHALIGVLGPELQEPGKVRSLVFLLVHEFGEETDEGLAVEAIKCVQQFLMFAPDQIEVPKLVSTFRTHLASTRRPLKVAAITALYQIVQRDAVLISKLGGNQLVEDLFGLLDDDPSIDGVRNVITSWLSQTAAALPSGWIDLCQRIMTRTTASQKSSSNTAAARGAIKPASGFMDDEGEGFASAELGSNSASGALSSRWRTQLFALQCLHNIVEAVAEGNRPEHFDPILARQLGISPKQMLFSRVADLIRMAFSASAALVVDVRLQGLVVLRDVITRFSAAGDPDFDGSNLLEQHQAPIAAALTPSFGNDTAPEVLASAVQVCAVFVGSGVIQSVGRMGRILKLLTGALEQCRPGSTVSLGDVEDLSPNAAVMFKISILAAWAELQIASVRQKYLVDVLNPYRYLLGPFWIGALRDYAQLRTDPEITGGSAVLDSTNGLGREVLLPYYEKAVPTLLHAVAISLSVEDPWILGAMDGQTFTSPTPPSSVPSAKPEPCVNFYILYGLAFESLVKSMGDSSSSSTAIVALRAMNSLVKPPLSGTTVFNGAFFDELCTVAYRIAMSESCLVKSEMCTVMAGFVSSRQGNMIVDPAQTRRVLAIITYTLRQTIPSRDTTSVLSYTDSLIDRIVFFRSAFTAFSKVVDCTDVTQRADLCVVGLHLFGDLLRDETPNMDYAGSLLPIMKGLLDQAIRNDVPGTGSTGEKIVHGLLSSCLTNVDDMRSRVNSTANIKIKNNLLAITLILTTLPPSIPVSKAVVEQISFVIGQYLGASAERPELGLTAVHCSSTILAASLRPNLTKPSAILQHAALHLLPPIITFLADSVIASASSTSTSDYPTSAIVSPEAITEVIKSLVSWVTNLPEEEAKRSRGYSVLLPTLCLLLDPSPDANYAGGGGGSQLHVIGITTLLGLAQNSPKAFKDATMSMGESERVGLEKAIREAVGNGATSRSGQLGGGGNEKRGIELRTFGN